MTKLEEEFAIIRSIESPSRSSPELSDLLSALQSLADYADRNFCRHDETHRGGVLWEICDQCGAKWADDEGGRPTDAGKLPEVIDNAYRLLDKHRGEKNV